MNVPPFWQKDTFTGTDRRGRQQTFAAFGWSFSSAEEAREQARSRARRIFDAVTGGRKLGEYDYLDRPIREEIVREVEAGGHRSLITRNRYGALVLNTSSVFFADVDDSPPPPRSLLTALGSLFSAKKRQAEIEALRNRTIEQVMEWGRAYPGHPFRLYRTHAGLRLLFVGRTYEPGSAEVASILEGLGADPLYKKLTETQECFRARLTPKPWRCGLDRPPAGFPWASRDAEARSRRWEESYAKAIAGYRTCELVDEPEATASDPGIREVVEIHDRLVRVGEDLPLA